MPTRLLFVDDDPFLLQAQRRLFWSVPDWSCTFCDSGAAALDHLAEQTDTEFDVLVSDMRMPNMSGAQLCAEVRARQPRCVRIMLSGQTESGTLCRTFGPSHQYLQKPCAPDELRQAVDRSIGLRDRLEHDNASATIRELKIADIAESRREVIRGCRTAATTKGGLLEPVSKDANWSAALECLGRLIEPQTEIDNSSLTQIMEPFDLGALRTLAAAACVYAHLCEEFTPYTDDVEETIATAVAETKSEASKVPKTAGWDVAQWAASRTDDEQMIANLLHNVSSLLPFKHQSQPQHLSAALLEHLGLPHSVVASVAARNLGITEIG